MPTLVTFTLHSASEKTAIMSSANCAASESPNLVKCTIDPRYIRREVTYLSWSALLIQRCAKRCWSSTKDRSAMAAFSRCLASSVSTFCCAALAFAASLSKAWALLLALAAMVLASAASCSALAARVCCIPSSVLATVSCRLNSRNLVSCSAFIRVLVKSTPAPNTNVINSRITPPISKNVFHPSSDIDTILNHILEITLIVLAILALCCAVAAPIVWYRAILSHKSISIRDRRRNKLSE